MKKKIILLFAISVLISFHSTVKAASAQVERLWGSDRYKTCSAIVTKGWQNSDCAVIVNGSNFPDALSASTLAKKYNAPILLTESDKLNSDTYNQLIRLNIKKAFIVGGTGVINTSIEDQLNAMNIQTKRFSGQDRTSTSVDVAKEIGTSSGIILTTDSSYTDALSVSPIAAKLQIPIILMPKDYVPDSVASFIKENNITKTYVVGGEDLISDSAVSNFPDVQRITGNDAYERNINVINKFWDKFDFGTAFLASSKDFADALSGSAFAALNGNPIVLVGDDLEDTTKSFIANKAFTKLYILGGTAGISDNTADVIANGGQASNPSTSQVTNVNAKEHSQGISLNVPNNLPDSLKYTQIQEDKLKSFLTSHNSLLAEEPYFSAILNSAEEYNVNPLLLFAITGQEENFVQQDGKDASKIANNPFNVYQSWQLYNTNIDDSSQIAARTVVKLCVDLPSGEDAFAWIGKKYAEDGNWGIKVHTIFNELEQQVK